MCPYKNIFGEPNTGSHKYRIFNLAIIDIIFTIIGAFLLYQIQYINRYISLLNFTISLFILGIITHRVFCVRTTIDKLLFPN